MGARNRIVSSALIRRGCSQGGCLSGPPVGRISLRQGAPFQYGAFCLPWATDEMFGFVLRLLADRPPEISASGDHRLGGSLWMNSGYSFSITMRISSEMT